MCFPETQPEVHVSIYLLTCKLPITFFLLLLYVHTHICIYIYIYIVCMYVLV